MTEDSPEYQLPRRRGRPREAEAKRNKCMRLSPDVIEYLAQLPHQTEWIESTIRRTAAYRAWLAARSTGPR